MAQARLIKRGTKSATTTAQPARRQPSESEFRERWQAESRARKLEQQRQDRQAVYGRRE